MMNSQKQLLAEYDSICIWFKNSLVGFTDEETNQRLNKNMNHAKYIAGHLLNTQYAFAMIGGVTIERKWDELFAGRGKTKALDDFPYPSIEEIKNEWEQLNLKVRENLNALTEDDLNKEIPDSPLSQSKVFDTTVGDFWAFINIHQVYHIGQIGILRRGFGKEPMKYR